MPTFLGHTISAIAIGSAANKSIVNWKFWLLGIIAAILPDADVLGLKWGIPYESFWGHRGFSHSFLFAFIVGLFFAFAFYQKRIPFKNRVGLIAYFFLATASHSLLDALTSGGLGVAFFSPWDNARYFFPWRPIRVSPLTIDSFLSQRGLDVILSELKWIGIPAAFWIMGSMLFRKIRN